jgi:hypothetical protein
MARSLLPLAASLLMGFTVLSVSAAQNDSPLPATSSDVHQDVDAKREQITGADAAATPHIGGAQPVLDAPIATDDAPEGNDSK